MAGNTPVSIKDIRFIILFMNKTNSKSDKFFSSLSIQTVITITMGLLEMVVFSILSRLLSRTDFGFFAVITALVVVFKCFSEAGFGSAIIQKEDNSEEHISTAFSLSVLTGLFFSILLFLLAPLFAKVLSVSEIVRPLRIMSIILIANSLASVGNAILTRKLQFLRIGIIKLVAYLISAIVTIIMAINGSGLYSIVTLHLSNSILCVLLLYTTSVAIPKFKFCKGEIKKIVSFGGWYTGNVFMNNLIVDIDKFLLPKLLSVQALGTYTRPTSFVTNLTSQVNSIFDTVLFPMLSGIQNDLTNLKNIFIRAMSLLNVFSIILSLAFIINAELIIRVFFGADWLDLVPILRIISISVIFCVDGRLVDCFFRSMGAVKLSFELRLVAFVITLSAVLIGSRFGVIGVAIGAVLSNIFVIILKVCVIVKIINVSFSEVIALLLKSVVPSIPIILLGTIYYVINYHTLPIQISLLVIFVVCIGIEMLLFPKFIGNEYYNMVYPKIRSFIKRRYK